MISPGIYSLGDFSVDAAADQVGAPVVGLDGMVGCSISARLAYGSGGTAIQAIVSTSLDQGTTWIPIARFDFAMVGTQKVANLSGMTPVTSPYEVADLSAEGTVDGILGDRLQCEIVSTGTYTNSTVVSVRVAVR